MKFKFLHFLLITFLFSVSCSHKENNSPNNPSPIEIIDIKGSDTMVNLALAWAEEYQKLYPSISISVTGGGTGTGLAALINNSIDIANASRKIKEEELQTAKENGVFPVEYVVAKDAIAIIVNPSNPINQITIEQLSDIYSGKINNWSELGGEDRPIVRLSRETNSGTHVYFLERVLRLGQKENKTLFSKDTLLLPSSEIIITEVRDNPNAIGYDGLGYITGDVKVISVADVNSDQYVMPTVETVLNNTYPIARDLYMYTIGTSKKNVDDYIQWIFTSEAQEIVSNLGFVPIKFVTSKK